MWWRPTPAPAGAGPAGDPWGAGRPCSCPPRVAAACHRWRTPWTRSRAVARALWDAAAPPDDATAAAAARPRAEHAPSPTAPPHPHQPTHPPFAQAAASARRASSRARPWPCACLWWSCRRLCGRLAARPRAPRPAAARRLSQKAVRRGPGEEGWAGAPPGARAAGGGGEAPPSRGRAVRARVGAPRRERRNRAGRPAYVSPRVQALGFRV